MSTTDNSALAYTHWKRSVELGFLYLVPGATVATLVYLTWGDNGYPASNAPLSTRLVSGGLLWVAYTLGAVFWGSILLGIPAVVVGLLRIWPMSWLFRYCLNDPAGPDTVTFLFGTFLIFEAPVLLLMFLFSGAAPAYSIGNGLLFHVAGLPWLCSSLRTSYAMMRAQESRPPEPPF